MQTAIYYFSATGNSLVVARDLATEMGGAQLIPVPKAVKSGSEERSGIIGIVFPVYMFGLPLIVAELLKKIRVSPGAYIFSVATFGGLQGRPHSLARRLLKKRGIELAAGFSVCMPGNYTPLYAALAKEKQEEMFRKEKLRVPAIGRTVRQQRHGIFEEKPCLVNLLLYKL